MTGGRACKRQCRVQEIILLVINLQCKRSGRTTQRLTIHRWQTVVQSGCKLLNNRGGAKQHRSGGRRRRRHDRRCNRRG